jgi:hypothetical protein
MIRIPAPVKSIPIIAPEWGKPVETAMNDNSTAWSISVTIGDTKYLLGGFSSKEDIQRYKKMATTLYHVQVTTEEGTVTDSKSFTGLADAEKYYLKLQKAELKRIEDLNNQMLEDSTAKLEKLMQVEEITRQDLLENPEEVDVLAIKLQHRSTFEAKKVAFTTKAKVFLHKASTFLLSGKKIPLEDHYLKDKLELDSDRLSNIFMQLDTVNRAIYNISEDMEVSGGNFSSKQYEALAQLIRLSMDITKYQNEITKEIRSYILEIKDSLDDDTETIEYEEVKTATGGLATRDRMQLLRELNLHLKNNSELIPMSSNPKLQDENDPTLGSAVELVDNKSEEVDDEEVENPLESFY